MYKVKIKTGQQGCPPLELKTEVRNWARAVKQICLENGLACVVEMEVAPREVKFKGVD